MRKALSLLALAAGCGLLAASALGSVSQAPPENTFRLGLNSGGVELDPAFIYSGGPDWALQYATGAMLFSYPDAPAPRGSRLIPEVAAGFPQVSRDGRTYTIRLKRTYRFNNGRRVTAKHFEFALLRAARSLDGSELIADVVGAREVRGRRAEQISGVRVLDPQTLRIRIRERKPDLLARLALPYFAAVPLNLPPRGRVQKPFLTAGPYSIREWTPRGRAILERNPFYRGPRPRRVQRIQVDVGLRPETIKQNVDSGALDAGDLLPLSTHAELARRYGVRRRSPGRYFENPTATVHYISFNHDRPLFRGPGPAGNVRLKQAISYAIDRAALVGLLRFSSNVTHDQLLPPSIRGFRDVSMYPRRPNLGRARRLAAGHTRDGKGLIFCGSGAREVAAQQCRALQEMLRPIGLELTRSSPCLEFCAKLPEHDLAFGGMRSAHFDPSEFFDLVDGARIDAPAFRPGNHANFNHPAFTRRIRLARQLSGPRRYAAWGRLDADIMRAAAPLAVYGAGTERHYVSARVGCYHHHPVYGFDFPALCLR